MFKTKNRFSLTGFTPLEKATDFNWWSLPFKADGEFPVCRQVGKPPSTQTVRERSSPTGFTLIELIIVVVILGIIALFLAPVMLSGVDSWEHIHNRSYLIDNGRLAINRMVREIRQAKEITTWEDDQITFTDVNDEVISFQQINSTLLRNDDDLADNLEDPGGLQFTYLDDNGDLAEGVEDIEQVKINLVLYNVAGSFRIQSQAYIRNLD